jgi:hypothetical protein
MMAAGGAGPRTSADVSPLVPLRDDGGVDWPRSWVGGWVAPDGKTVELAVDGPRISVTVRPGPGREPYRSAELLEGGTVPIRNLEARCARDDKGIRHLEVEAGTPTLGPTYRLYPAAVDADGRRHPAADDVPVERIVLLPATSIGLYDDWDDDFGVPWAYPLEPLRRRPARV